MNSVVENVITYLIKTCDFYMLKNKLYFLNKDGIFLYPFYEIIYKPSDVIGLSLKREKDLILLPNDIGIIFNYIIRELQNK